MTEGNGTNGMTYIYALWDPRDGAVRYVGKANHPWRRLRAHLESDPSRDSNQGRLSWLADLAADGFTPKLRILEQVRPIEWQDAERYWIALGHRRGWPLLNISPGGGGYSAWSVGDFECIANYVTPELYQAFMGLPRASKQAICMAAAKAMASVHISWLTDGKPGTRGEKEQRQSLAGCDAARLAIMKTVRATNDV